MSLPAGFAIVVITVVVMEGVAAAVHKYVMHGWGWAWHRSHHEPHEGALERNDLYSLVFAALSLGLIWQGARLWTGLTFVGWGMAAYGLLYFMVHDGLVHQRWPLRRAPQFGYLKRLVQAHRLHHASERREHCVSFGFLYAPPIPRLKDQMRGRGTQTREAKP